MPLCDLRHPQRSERPRRHRRLGHVDGCHRRTSAAVGDQFVVHTDRESLNDFPLGKYDVTIAVCTFEQDREIAWKVLRSGPATDRSRLRLHTGDGRGRHVGDVVLRLVEHRSGVEIFPIISEGALRATLGILARNVEPGLAVP